MLPPSMTLCQEIETLIRARYPILYIVSAEEQRVQQLVTGIAQRRQKKTFEWSCTTGLVPAGTSIQSAQSRNAATKDPAAALDQVIAHVEPAIFLFKDFHPYLSKGNAVVVRKLRDIAQQLKHSQKTIVLVCPVMEIPPELEKEITLLNLPLPGLDELGTLLDGIIAEVKSVGRIRIEANPGGRERLLQSALGLTLAEAENVFAKILVQHERLSGDHVPDVLAEKRQIIKKNGLLEYYDAAETFTDIGGLAVLKDWLRKRSAAFSEEARAFGLPWPKGILLVGVQGCGKSLCAKAVASSWQLPLLRFDVGRMFGSYVGSSEENIRRAIAVAESIAPAILWVDEIDKAFAGFQSSGIADGGTAARVFGTFLTWLSEKSAPVFVVATANEISKLPPELMRKGRFDEIFFIDLPSEQERREIFAIHIRRRGRDPQRFDLAAAAAASRNFSGAEIEQAVVSALYEAYAERTDLAFSHLMQAVEQTVPLATTMNEQIGALRAWVGTRARSAAA